MRDVSDPGVAACSADPAAEESTVFRERRRIWSETADRVARIAGGLKEVGVRPGDRVAILALNSDRYFELMYAIPWIGAAMVPINTRLAAPEIEYILRDSGAWRCSSTRPSRIRRSRQDAGVRGEVA